MPRESSLDFSASSLALPESPGPGLESSPAKVQSSLAVSERSLVLLENSLAEPESSGKVLEKAPAVLESSLEVLEKLPAVPGPSPQKLHKHLY